MKFFFQPEPHSQDTIKALWKLEKIVLDTLNFDEVVQRIVDSVLVELGYLNLGYRIIVLILHNPELSILKRISLSQTPEAAQLLATTKIPFPQMDISMNASNNLCVRCFNTQIPTYTEYWPDILTPPFAKEDALYYQRLVGIKTSMVYPVIAKGKTLGVLIFSMTKPVSKVTDEERDLISSFTSVVGIAVQNAKLYSDLENTTKALNIANENLKIANIKLQELDKLKDEFVSLASHELRAPMTVIKGSLSTILDGYAGETSKEAKEFLTAAYSENDRLIRLVNNLLNISRIESGRLKFLVTNVDMSKLMKDVVTNLQMAAKEKSLRLIIDKLDQLPFVLADEDKVREVLINLIGNAIKFTHQGGITVSAKVEKDMLITSVADTGNGIAPEDQELLFKKFSQVSRGTYSRQTGGTGLGLYISKKIIEGLHGQIWLTSTVGKGTTFYFSLPVVK